MGAAAAGLGDTALARQCLGESLAIARQVNDRTREILCLGHLGWLGVQEGNAGEALEHLRVGLALAEQVNSGSEQSGLHAGLAEAMGLAGQQEQALVHARRAVVLAEASGRVVDREMAKRTLAHLVLVPSIV